MIETIGSSCLKHEVALLGLFDQPERETQVNLQIMAVDHLLVNRVQRWKSFAQRDRWRGQDHLET